MTRQAIVLLAAIALTLAVHTGGAGGAACEATWTDAVDGSFTDPAKWTFTIADADNVPDADDTVCINHLTGSEYTVTLTDATLTIDTLSLGRPAGAPLARLVLDRSSLTLGSTSDLSAIAATGELELTSSGASQAASLAAPVGMVVTNLGRIDVLPGTGGARTIGAQLANQGMLDIDTDLALTGSSTNSGAVDVASGATLTAPVDGFSQLGGTLANSGSVVGNFVPWTHSGGSVTGNPVVLFGSPLTVSGAGAGAYVMRGNSTLGGTVSADKTITVRGDDSAASLSTDPGTTNNGTIELTSIDGTNENATLAASGAGLSNGGTLRISPGAGGARTITGGVDNLAAGTFDIDESLGLANLTNAGTVDVAAGETVTVSSGSVALTGGTVANHGTFELILAALTHTAGTVTDQPVSLTGNSSLNPSGTGSAVYLARDGSTTLTGNVAADKTIRVRGGGTSATLRMTAARTNAGTIVLESVAGAAPSATLSGSGAGSLANAATGTIRVDERIGGGAGDPRTVSVPLINGGTVDVNESVAFEGEVTNNGTLDIAAGKTASQSFFGGGFTQNGTIANAGALIKASGTFTHASGNVTGNAPDLTGVVLDPSGSGTAAYVLHGPTNTLAGDVQQDKTLTLQAQGAGAALQLTANRTNAGTIKLDSTTAHSVQINNNGPAGLTNLGTGTIESNVGGGGSRTLDLDLTNAGTLDVNQNTGLGSAKNTVNSGTIDIATGKVLTKQSGPMFQNAGVISGPGTLQQNSGFYTHTGGDVTGSPVVIAGAVTFNPSGAGNAEFVVSGADAVLSGDVSVGKSVTVRGGPFSASLLLSNPRTNSGTIRLDSSGPGGATLGTAAHTLTNVGSLEVNETSSGPRTINSPLSNSGVVTIDESTTFSQAVTNSGAFTVTGGETVTLPSFTQSAGSTTLNDGSILDPTGSATVADGLLTGTGTVAGNLQNTAGELRPGGSPGTFTVQGDYTQGPGGELTAEVQGTAAGTGYDRLAVTGAATLDGELTVDSNGFTPVDADVFDLVTAGSRSGTFSTVTGLTSAGGGRRYALVYVSDRVRLTVVPRHSLDVTRAGTGQGTVTSNPAGIDCGSDCAHVYDDGTEVILTATGSAGSSFTGWSGAGCAGTGGCAVTMTEARAVTATFTTNPSDPPPEDPPAGDPPPEDPPPSDPPPADTPPADAPPADTPPTTSGPLRGACANVKRGTRGGDRLIGTRLGDLLIGLGGSDVLEGRAGADCLEGRGGKDRLSGGAGRDKLAGGAGRDAFAAGAGNDRINSRDGRREIVKCGTGRDTVIADRVDRLRGCERRKVR